VIAVLKKKNLQIQKCEYTHAYEGWGGENNEKSG
jgi:hypothetical protein